MITDFPNSTYKCILADPPWPISMAGQRKRIKEGKKPDALPYKTMSIDDICSLSVSDISDGDCHLWLWTTNQSLEDGFRVMREWGFKYLAPIHAIKPTGMGNWFVHRTQTILFGYKEKCKFPLSRYQPNIIRLGNPRKHSEKADITYRYIEAISPGPRIELFARRKIDGWDCWGDEIK